MRLLDRYIGHSIGIATLATLAVLLILIAFITVVDEMSDVGKGSYQLPDVLFYVLLNVPQILYELFPVAVLLGSLIGLGGLAAGSELTAMRAAGVSVRRITYATLKVGAIIILTATLIGELIAPEAQRYADILRASKIANQITVETRSGFWARDGSSYVNIGHILPDATLRNLAIYHYHSDGTLEQITLASSAAYQHDHWQLHEVTQTRFHDGRPHPIQLATLAWESSLKPNLLHVIIVRPRMLSTWGLYRYIGFMRDNGQDAAAYEVALWSKLLTPLNIVAMILLTIPVVFGLTRNIGVGQRIFIGTLIGIVFFLSNRMFGNMAIVYGLPPLLAASAPSLAALAAAFFLGRRIHN